MRRVRKLVAKNSSERIIITISIQVDAKNGELTRWEMQDVLDEATDRIMRDLPSTKYVYPSLNRIKVV